MNQTERITYMEQILDKVSSAVSNLSEALKRYTALLPALRELSDYYSSPLWLQDFEDDEAGRLPANLKRGVLSEDAVYDLLDENRRLLENLHLLHYNPDNKE
jgi:hypothetical protein